MNRPYVCLILCFICVAANAQTTYQHNSPEWLVYQFFSASSFPDKSNFFTDEMIKQINYPSIGEELRGEGTSKLKEIQRSNDEAVFSVNISKHNDQKDFYCYLKNQNGWKISAIRTFIIPAYYHQLADSIMNDAALPDSTKTIAHSIRLLAGNDENMKNHLKLNLLEFKRLLDHFRNGADTESHTMLQKLYLSSLYKPDQLIDCFFFVILEINYLEAGYIYCNDKLRFRKLIRMILLLSKK
jgi:uncharacterized membrane protein YciS (DUF1049 family)